MAGWTAAGSDGGGLEGGGVDGPGPGVPPFGPTPVTWPLPPSKVTSEQAKKFSVLSERTQRE